MSGLQWQSYRGSQMVAGEVRLAAKACRFMELVE